MKFNIKGILVYGICLTILVVIIISFFNLKTYTKKMITDLDKIILYIKDENWEISESSFEKFNEDYKDKIENFSMIINKKEVDEALLSMVDVLSNIQLKDKNICLSKIENLKFHILNFYRSQIPNFKNVL